MKITKQRKKPNCKQGNVACGKRCQPRHYKCPSEKGTEVSEASDKFVDNILAITADIDAVATADAASSASTLVSSPAQKTLASPSEEYQGHLAKLINIFDGELLSTGELKEAAKVFSNDYAKAKKVKKPSKKLIEEIKKRIGENLLSNEEIMAAIQWVSFESEDFKSINKVLYDSGFISDAETEYGEKIGTLLASCLKKLKGSELEYSKENLSLHSDEEYSTLKIRADGKIVRYLDIAPSNIERYLKPYRDALDKREVYVEKTFAAATLGIDSFSHGRRVEIEIEPLSEGKSSAILLEKFKKENSDECEVMMPPGCKYEVIDVRQKTIEDWIPKITVSQAEILDEYNLTAPKSLDEIESFMSLLNSTLKSLTATSDYFKSTWLRSLSLRFKSFAQKVKTNPEGFDSSYIKIVLRELPSQGAGAGAGAEIGAAEPKPDPKPKVSTEEYYNSSLALFSKESKVSRRAKIKGLSNEKELKKVQLKEENEAWIFVRLKRELDRLKKKDKDAEEITALEDLLSKIIDGDEGAKAEGKERVEGKVKKSETKEIEDAKVEAILEAVETEAPEEVAKKAGEVEDSVEVSATSAAVATATAPAQPAMEEVVEADEDDRNIDISTWKKVGAQAGSNPGGFYEDEKGNKYYVKKSKSRSHAENERLASLLYKEAGIDSIEVKLGTNGDGNTYTVSPIIERKSGELLEDKINDTSFVAEVGKGFAVDAWLANWDVVGTGFDNIIIGEDGRPVRVDPGGALMWRARGEAKGKAFNDKVTELETFLDSDLNYSSAKFFKKLSEDEKKKSAERVRNISDERIRSIVAAEITDESERAILAERLVARKKELLRKLKVKPTPQPELQQEPKPQTELVEAREDYYTADEKLIASLSEKAREMNIPLLEKSDLKDIEGLKKFVREAWDEGEDTYGWGTPEFRLFSSRRDCVEHYLLRNEERLAKMSDEELDELLKYANEAILLSPHNLMEGEKAARRLIYFLSGDSLEKIKAVGDESLRGKKDIPPLPEKFRESNSEPVDESFRNFLEEAQVIVQVTPNALEGILAAGRMKNMFEAGAIDGIGEGQLAYENKRKRVENKKFSVGKEESSDRRPIYGYIESPHYANGGARVNGVEHYGRIQVRLKSDVKKRSTITLGDSLDDSNAMPTPILDPRIESLASGQKIRSEGGAVNNLVISNSSGSEQEAGEDYIEAQIFGGISLDDIDSIAIPAEVIKKFPYLIALLEKYGITLVVI